MSGGVGGFTFVQSLYGVGSGCEARAKLYQLLRRAEARK